MTGWIKLYRQLLECDLWIGIDTENEEPFDRRSAWVDLLLRANHKEKTLVYNGEKIVVGRGQIFTSIRKLGSRWHWSSNKVLRFLNTLETYNMVNTNGYTNGTLLTLVNYAIYQSDETLTDTDAETPTDTATDTATAYKQEYKELKNKRNNNIVQNEPKFCELILKDNSLYPIYESDVNNYKELYPKIDVEQQLRSMVGWCDSNPQKRKTRSGVRRFINSWLSRENDRKTTAPATASKPKFNDFENKQNYDDFLSQLNANL